MIDLSPLFFVLTILAFSMNLTNPFGEMPELNQNQTNEPEIDTIKVCSLVDTLMPHSDPNKAIKDYMCFSA